MTTNETTTGKEATLSALRVKSDDIKNLPSVNIGFGNLQSFELTQRAAKLLAASDLVPQQYKGNIANCVVALNMAARVGADPLMVMQNLDVVRGRPSWRAKFLISTVNTCGRFTALRYEWFGEQGKDDWGCRAWAIEKSTGEKLIGPDISIALSKREGWYDKKDSKWQSIPQKMLMYRAGAWWSDLYAPELAMGLQTREEVFDTIDADKLDDGTFAVNLDTLRQETNEVNVVKQNAEAASSTMPILQDYLDGIAAAPTVAGVEHKFNAALEIFGKDLDAAAALMLAKESREAALKGGKKLFAKPEGEAAA